MPIKKLMFEYQIVKMGGTRVLRLSITDGTDEHQIAECILTGITGAESISERDFETAAKSINLSTSSVLETFTLLEGLRRHIGHSDFHLVSAARQVEAIKRIDILDRSMAAILTNLIYKAIQHCARRIAEQTPADVSIHIDQALQKRIAQRAKIAEEAGTKAKKASRLEKEINVLLAQARHTSTA